MLLRAIYNKVKGEEKTYDLGEELAQAAKEARNKASFYYQDRLEDSNPGTLRHAYYSTLLAVVGKVDKPVIDKRLEALESAAHRAIYCTDLEGVGGRLSIDEIVEYAYTNNSVDFMLKGRNIDKAEFKQFVLDNHDELTNDSYVTRGGKRPAPTIDFAL